MNTLSNKQQQREIATIHGRIKYSYIAIKTLALSKIAKYHKKNHP